MNIEREPKMPVTPIRLIAAAALALGLLLPAVAAGQTVGSITGTIYDQTGLPLRGIKVTAESATQIGGPRVAYSNDEGNFRITGLLPGKFTVTAEALKLKKHIQKNVRVGVNSAAELDIVMEVETEVVEIKVVEKAPTISTTNANVKETFDEEFINNIPVAARSYQGITNLVAGVTDNGTGNPNMRGGTYFNNTYTVDGIDTTDPVTHTFGTNFNFDAMADVEVQTAAYGAENSSTTGGVINVVTKSGSNKFELDTSLTYTDQNLQLFKDSLDRGTNRRGVFNVNVGGPIRKDKLWFFVSTEGTNRVDTLSADPYGVFPDHPSFSVLGGKAFAKLTWQVTPRNKLQAASNAEYTSFNNYIQSYLVEPEAEARQYQQINLVNVWWESLLSDNLFLKIQGAAQRIFLDVGPQSCVWDEANCPNIAQTFDVASGVQRTNRSFIVKDYRRRVLLNTDLEWFKDTKKFGNHDVKFGTRLQAIENPSSETVTGDAVFYTRGSQPYAKSEFCANDPKESMNVCRPGWLHTNVTGQTAVVFLQDAWKPTRYVTLTPGVALDYGGSEDDRKKTVTSFTTFTPHVSAVWDATHDGRTAVRASFNQYVDTGFLALARFAGKALFEKTCFWDEEAKSYTADCSTAGGNDGYTVGLPYGPDAVGPDGKPLTRKLVPPRTWEYTLGAEREIMQGVSLGADFIYRKFNHLFEDIETNLIWNESGTGLRADGGYKDGKAHYVFDLETPDEANRRYRALTAVLRKKEGRFKVVASYTLSENLGQQESSYASVYLDNPKNSVYWNGYLNTDARHVAKVQGSYQATPWLSVGTVYQFQSGTPYNRWYYNPYYRGFYDLRAPRGYDPRDVNDPDDDRPLRLPDLSLLDFQARANLKKFTGQQLEVWGDMFNVLGLRTNTSVITNDGPFWGQPTTRLAPTRVRFGLRFRY